MSREKILPPPRAENLAGRHHLLGNELRPFRDEDRCIICPSEMPGKNLNSRALRGHGHSVARNCQDKSFHQNRPDSARAMGGSHRHGRASWPSTPGGPRGLSAVDGLGVGTSRRPPLTRLQSVRRRLSRSNHLHCATSIVAAAPAAFVGLARNEDYCRCAN